MEHRLILASKSPRRRDLLGQLGLNFETMTREVDETFPEGMPPAEAVCFIAEKKANAFADVGQDENTVILAADTIVVVDGNIIGKPADEHDAFTTLSRLSGRTHQVITGCAIRYKGRIHRFHETTDVLFKTLDKQEILHYIRTFKPFDKAGAYGIQEWIGLIGVKEIKGSYSNVVGLPTARLYEVLKTLGVVNI